jgi:uncharacterized phage-associated protein
MFIPTLGQRLCLDGWAAVASRFRRHRGESGEARVSMLYKGKSIANAFLTLANRDGYRIDPLKLQKLLYYANGYYMAEHAGQPLINEHFEAWDYGPVIPTVYYEFREYKDGPIKRFAYTWDRSTAQMIVAPQPVGDPAAGEVISWVWDQYKNYSGLQLSEMTHKEGSPWHNARSKPVNYRMRNERLEPTDILDYFKALGVADAA